MDRLSSDLLQASMRPREGTKAAAIEHLTLWGGSSCGGEHICERFGRFRTAWYLSFVLFRFLLHCNCAKVHEPNTGDQHVQYRRVLASLAKLLLHHLGHLSRRPAAREGQLSVGG
eukprot:4498460-Amphidinium_carterae.1